jgi:hypothetical protein
MAQDDTEAEAGLPDGMRPEGDDWVIPVPARGSPAFAVMPWRLFLRLRNLAQGAAADSAAIHDGEIAIRDAGSMTLVSAFDSDLGFDDVLAP